MSTRFARSIALSFLAVLPFTLRAQELAITNVQPSSAQVDPRTGERVQFRFVLNRPATVVLSIYDGRELRIREIASQVSLRAGENTLSWDLRDQNNITVPPEAYTYTFKATTAEGKAVRFDLADVTGGTTIEPRDVKWDARTGTLSYVLERPSRVNVRLGLDGGGPLLRTLLDWVVRPAGLQREAWDGKDAAGVIDISAHPRLTIGVQAFSLPDNVILVGSPQQEVKLIEPAPVPPVSRPKSGSPPKQMYSHAQQPLAQRGDFKVKLTLPNTLRRSNTGVPIVGGRIPVRLEIDARDRERALARRFEPVFFIDGQFAFENEVGFVPMTWNFDPAALNEGEHYLTVNLRGYEGNFGMATVKVLVKRASASTSGKDER